MNSTCLCSRVARTTVAHQSLHKISAQISVPVIARRLSSCVSSLPPLSFRMFSLHRFTGRYSPSIMIGWCSSSLGQPQTSFRYYCTVIGRRSTSNQSPTCFRSYCTLIGWRFADSQSATRWALLGRHVFRHASQSAGSGGRHSTAANYMLGVAVLFLGLSYAAVPLYSVFCQATGYSGAVADRVEQNQERIRSLQPIKSRTITVNFNADINSAMAWEFKPLQNQITIKPGETALAFYSAKNPTDKPINGVATYNVVPFEAGAYFNKIQCFCFEEQRLNPNEEVDMPVFFYIDPDFAGDQYLRGVDDIYLSYTFFESKPGLKLPLPGYSTPVPQQTA